MGDAALRGANTVRPHTTVPKKLLTIGEFLKTHGTTLDKHIAERFKMGIREGLRRSNLSLKDIESFLESKEFKAILEEKVKEFQKHFGSNEKIPNPKEALDHLNSRIKGYAIDLTQKIAPALEKAKLVGKTLDVKSILTGKKDVPIGTPSKVVKFEKPHQPPKNLGSPLGRGVVDVPTELREAAARNPVAHLADRISVKEDKSVLAKVAKFIPKVDGFLKKAKPLTGWIPHSDKALTAVGLATAVTAAALSGKSVAQALEAKGKEVFNEYNFADGEAPIVSDADEKRMIKEHEENHRSKPAK